MVRISTTRNATLSVVLFAATTAARADGPICGPHPRAWDQEHALIQEADLTTAAVEKAKADIRALKSPPPDAPGELEIFAAVGQAMIEGYRLKQEYERQPSPAAKQKFCIWMRDHAYWPE